MQPGAAESEDFMEIHDIVCGICGSHDFKSIEGEATCQVCGYILSDTDIENILEQTYKDAMLDDGKDYLRDCERTGY